MSKLLLLENEKEIISSIGLDCYVSHPITYDFFIEHFNDTIKYIENINISIDFYYTEYGDPYDGMNFTDYMQDFLETLQKTHNLPYTKDDIFFQAIPSERTQCLVTLPLNLYILFQIYDKFYYSHQGPAIYRDPIALGVSQEAKEYDKVEKKFEKISKTNSYKKIGYLMKNNIQKAIYKNKSIRKRLISRLSKSLGDRDPKSFDQLSMEFWLTKRHEEKDIKKIMEEKDNNMLAYIVFLLFFFETPHVIIETNKKIEIENGYITDWILVDNETLEGLIKNSFVGKIISLNMDFWSDIRIKLQGIDGFELLKKQVKEYCSSYGLDEQNKEKTKRLSIFLLEQLKRFGKVEFHIGTKAGNLESIQTIVTESNPKKFNNTKEKLPGDYMGSEEKILPKKKTQRIYKSRSKI